MSSYFEFGKISRLVIIFIVLLVVILVVSILLLLLPKVTLAKKFTQSDVLYIESFQVGIPNPIISFTVSTIFPLSNLIGINSDTYISATLSQSLNTSTVNTNTFRVRGDQSGFYDGSFSYPGVDVLHFDSSVDFKPGELIYVTASNGLQSSLGSSLSPYHWTFTTDVVGGSGSMKSHSSFGGGNSFGLAVGDLDGDSDLDAIIANFSGQAQNVWLNNIEGNTTLNPTNSSFGAGDSTSVALGDLDSDGDLDAVVTNYFDQAQTVWVNNGSGSFSPHSTATFGGNHSRYVAFGDLDGDGDLDAVVANDIHQPQTVWINNGTGTFIPHPTTPSFGTGHSTAVVLGDIDGDGDLDAVIANKSEQAQTVWVNDGNGSFSAHPIWPSFGTGNSYALALGDLDSDGDLDLIVGNVEQAQTMWLNNGKGVFYINPNFPIFGSGWTYAVELGDLDSDGDLDVVIANYMDQAQTVWLNNGSGTFTPHPITPSFGSGRSWDLSLGDLDGDGDLDALVANDLNAGETVWMNDYVKSYFPIVYR
jgi:hypothetical protein